MFKVLFIKANLWLYNFTSFLPRQIVVVAISLFYIFELIKEFKSRFKLEGTSINVLTSLVRDSLENFLKILYENKYLRILTYPSENFLFTWNFSILMITYAIIKSL